ncbi:MAG: T9SS type A sorting domain-containing protein [Saprospiraceae bacterium]
MKKTIYLLFLLLTATAHAQVTLKPTIGLNSEPLGTDSICTIPWYLGEFEDSGLMVGDTAFDFTLYSMDGQAFNLASVLESGKPVVLVGGNYTCPVFRNKVPDLNSLIETYGDSVFFAIIYGIEAHPDIDISPYFGYVNTGAQNINAGILYQQPLTYGQRLDIGEDMLSEMDIDAPVYFDGPCNPWWAHYGPAPNNAYLIGTDGIVYAKHGWFNRYPQDMACDLDAYFNSNCDPGSGNNNGQFVFEKISQDTVYGIPGITLYTEAELRNESDAPVEILVKRLLNNLPNGWESSLCLDVCYPSSVDSTLVLLEPGETQSFHFYFYTDDHDPGFGHARVGFRNQANFQNSVVYNVFGSTDVSTNTLEKQAEGLLKIWPNPGYGQYFISDIPTAERIQILDLQGQVVYSDTFSQRLDILTLPSGFYIVQVMDGAGRMFAQNKLVKVSAE